MTQRDDIRDKGVPEYTQHSIAFPNTPVINRSEVDDLSIGFNARDGGTYGELKVTFLSFQSSNGKVHAHLEVFGDGLEAMLDHRFVLVLDRWRAWQAENADASCTPELFIGWLESEGWQPSSYQLEGLSQLPRSHPARLRTRTEVDVVDRWKAAQ